MSLNIEEDPKEITTEEFKNYMEARLCLFVCFWQSNKGKASYPSKLYLSDWLEQFEFFEGPDHNES